MYPPYTVFGLFHIFGCQVTEVAERQSGHAGKYEDITYQNHIVFWQGSRENQIELLFGQAIGDKRFCQIIVIQEQD